jgi:hypothetical protein
MKHLKDISSILNTEYKPVEEYTGFEGDISISKMLNDKNIVDKIISCIVQFDKVEVKSFVTVDIEYDVSAIKRRNLKVYFNEINNLVIEYSDFTPDGNTKFQLDFILRETGRKDSYLLLWTYDLIDVETGETNTEMGSNVVDVCCDIIWVFYYVYNLANN